MCPACLASLGVVLAKAASAGAVTAFVVKKLRNRKIAGVPAPRPGSAIVTGTAGHEASSLHTAPTTGAAAGG
ncbi:uncharacterized protein SOCE836_018540 [Sorangium cellulosum]|uniref:Secreted protein n=1 Tax=Sorangium cellulosum TaxID=56 RepID=A0A4P2QJF6_SORCE|nr:uncharacterized protein SOCE836_018540 [Sorangium cellulosum]WCQ89151.1 hypothetical protein NQZ70_01838 [Sorangium sp. Soce836]